MNQFEEQRAWEVFENELTTMRDPRAALRAAIVDFESRLLPEGRQRVAMAEIARPLVDRHSKLIRSVCTATRADLDVTCSFGRASSTEVDARGVLVALFSDRGLSSRQIAEGLGMSHSVVNNCRVMRKSCPDWEPLIARYAALMG
jgi:hypothetical protein